MIGCPVFGKNTSAEVLYADDPTRLVRDFLDRYRAPTYRCPLAGREHGPRDANTATLGSVTSENHVPTVLYGLIALFGAVVFTSSLIVLHLRGADIDWTRHYVSSFANGPLGWVFVWGALVHSVGNLALTLGLRRSLDPGPLRAWAVVLLGLAAGGISIIALVPIDPVGSSLTLTGLVHRVALSVSLPVELVALFLFSIAFRRDRRWRRRSGPSFVLSTIAASALAGFLLAVLLNQTPAVAERLALASVMAWEFWAAFQLIGHGLGIRNVALIMAFRHSPRNEGRTSGSR